MMKRGRLLKRGLLAITIVGAMIVSLAPSAGAHNHVDHDAGEDCLVALHWNTIGSVGWADSETCATRDNYYRGRVRDDHATSDKSCVYALFIDPINGSSVVMASSCNSSGSGFTFLDPQRNYTSDTAVCRSKDGFCAGTWNDNY